MLKLGNKTISKLYLGGKAISKAYLGDRLVFQAGKPLFLEYVEFDGASWIDTGLVAKNGLSVKLDHQLTKNNITQQLFGGRSATDKRFGVACVITGDGTHYDLCVLTDNYGSYFGCDLLRHTLEFNSDNSGASLSVDNKVFVTTTNVNNQEVNLFLGANNYTNKIPAYMRAYSCEMYDNGVLVRDFKPCIAPNGQVAMYDMVTKKYFYNKGTGTLKAGGRFVESIVFDGDSYIDTGIKSLSTWKIGAVGEQTNYLRFLIANGGAAAQLFGYHSSGYWCLGAPTEFHFNTPFTQYIDCTVTFSNGLVTATVGEQTLTRTGNTSTANYFLGGWHGTNSYYFKGKVYYCKNYNSEGTLIQDLRPYVDADGVACFKDLVTNTLFYNQGTGTLTYTEVQ